MAASDDGLDAAIAAHRAAEAALKLEETSAVAAMTAYLAARDPLVAAAQALACDDHKVKASRARGELLAAQALVRAALSRVSRKDEAGVRRCACCARALEASVSYFAAHARGRDGLSSACLACIDVQRECKMDHDLLWQDRFRVERERGFEAMRGGVPLESWALSKIVENEPEDWESPVDVERRRKGPLGREKCSMCRRYFLIRVVGPLAGVCPDCAGKPQPTCSSVQRIDRRPVASLEIAMPSLNGTDASFDVVDAVNDWFGDTCE